MGNVEPVKITSMSSEKLSVEIKVIGENWFECINLIDDELDALTERLGLKVDGK